MELIEVACQGKSGFLDPGDPDMSVESFSAGKELKVEVLAVVIVEILNRYADHSALVRNVMCCTLRPEKASSGQEFQASSEIGLKFSIKYYIKSNSKLETRN